MGAGQQPRRHPPVSGLSPDAPGLRWQAGLSGDSLGPLLSHSSFQEARPVLGLECVGRAGWQGLGGVCLGDEECAIGQEGART